MDGVTTLIIGERPSGVQSSLAAAVVPSLGGVKDAALRAATPLLWVLAGDAVPDDRALESLSARGARSPAVSLPLTAAGRPADAWIGTFADDELAALLAAARERRAPLRFTPVYSLLVRRELVISHERPDDARFGPYAGIEWTARLFSDTPGMLVPESTVTMPQRRRPLAPSALLRLGTRSALRRIDLLRQIRLAAASRRT